MSGSKDEEWKGERGGTKALKNPRRKPRKSQWNTISVVVFLNNMPC